MTTGDPIGRADYELRAPIDPLKKDLAAARSEIQKTGEATEAAFTKASSRWAPVLAAGVRTGIKVTAAAAAGMFAIATRGAEQLQQVQNDYQAATGASAEEARRAGKVINRVAGETQLSLESVSAAAVAVHNDLGLVGDQADAVTAAFARYARVTKQDAGGAVKAFDDILDAWNLTAADSQALMDKLLVSQQKFGGSVVEDQQALARLAPAMTAANMSIDDGIALLDLFKASGVDASVAVAGMTKALGKVKSPEELQKLITDISATEDPFLRAQKAAALFGAKAGPQMAAALAKTGGSLDSFRISADEAAGATTRANDALDQGFGAQLRKKISELGATIRGLGADWGPMLTGAAAVVSGLASLGLDKVLAGLWRRVMGSTALKTAVAAAGAASGAIYAAAASAAETLTGAVSGAWSRLAIAPAVTTAVEGAGAAAGASFAAAAAVPILAALAASIAAFATIPHDQRTRPGANTLDLGAMAFVPPKLDPKALEGVFDNVDWDALAKGQTPRLESAGEIIAGGLAQGAAKAAPAVTRAMSTPLSAFVDNAKAAGRRSMAAYAQGILDARQKPVDAFNTLEEMLKKPLTRGAEQARLLGELASKQLQQGLKSKDPAIRAQAQATKQAILDRLDELATTSSRLSKKTARLVVEGLKSKDAEVRRAALRIAMLAKSPLASLNGFVYGRGFTNGFIRGLVADIDRVGANARAIAHVVRQYLQVRSPSELGPFSELGGPEGWGGRFGSLYARGLQQGLDQLGGMLGTSLPSAAFPAAAAAAMGAAGARNDVTTVHQGGNIGHLVVNVHGIGSDVSPAAASRFGRQVLDEVAKSFRETGARRGFTTTVRP